MNNATRDVPVNANFPASPVSVPKNSGMFTSSKSGLKNHNRVAQVIQKASAGSKFANHKNRIDRRRSEAAEGLIDRYNSILEKKLPLEVVNQVDMITTAAQESLSMKNHHVYFDMDCYYVNLELLRHPELKGRPLVVGRGLCSASSYEARRYGITAGMAEHIARTLCPSLHVVALDHSHYRDMSDKILAFIKERFPIYEDIGYFHDEAGVLFEGTLEEAETFAMQVKAAILEEFKLTVSVGIAPTPIQAKMASDFRKPNGFFSVCADSFQDWFYKMNVRKVFGIGPSQAHMLESIGVTTTRHLFEKRYILFQLFPDKTAARMVAISVGGYNREMRYGEGDAKSVGKEVTFGFGSRVGTGADLHQTLEEVFHSAFKRLTKQGYSCGGIAVKMKTIEFEVKERSHSFNGYLHNKDVLVKVAHELFDALHKDLGKPSLRLLGVRFIKLSALANAIQTLDRWADGTAKKELPAEKCCPICSKSLMCMSNREINSHIDGCLAQPRRRQSNSKATKKKQRTIADMLRPRK
ncbi:hypothetical protein PCE1_004961 [Barthelona sp. PCE]